MKQQHRKSDDLANKRFLRVVASLFLLGAVVYGIVSVARERSVSPQYCVAIFCCYALFSSFLITWIVARLYRQHEFREMKFDLASLILLSVLIALPFAAANIFWDMFRMGQINGISEDKPLFLLLMTSGAAFLLFPIFLLTEALLSLSNTYLNHRNSSSHQRH